MTIEPRPILVIETYSMEEFKSYQNPTSSIWYKHKRIWNTHVILLNLPSGSQHIHDWSPSIIFPLMIEIQGLTFYPDRIYIARYRLEQDAKVVEYLPKSRPTMIDKIRRLFFGEKAKFAQRDTDEVLHEAIQQIEDVSKSMQKTILAEFPNAREGSIRPFSEMSLC